MLISVIVPVYKVEPYLRGCVDSVLGQTLGDFELILVDDGSPDNCGRICDEYAAADARIKVIHQENGGLSAARNAGIDYAMASSDSEFITFVDSDDWVSPDCLAELHRGVSLGVDVSCASCYYVFNDNAKCRRCEGDEWVVGSPEDYWLDSMSLGQVSCAKLYRKSFFSDVRFPVGRFHEDVYTTHRLLFRCGKIAYANLPLYFYRMRRGSIVHQESVASCNDAVEGLDCQASFFKDRGDGRLRSVVLGRKLALMISLLPYMGRMAPELEKKYRDAVARQSPEIDSRFWDGREYYRSVRPRGVFYLQWLCHVLWDLIVRGPDSWMVKCLPSVLRLSKMERNAVFQYS